MARAEDIEIRDGIEWFTVHGEFVADETSCQCARCGSSAEFVNCANCGGEGEIDRTDDWEWPTIDQCDWCRGTGGSWHCVSSPEWCTAHPLPGREQIESTAMSSDAWRDVF